MGHPLGRVNLAGNENNYATSAIELGDVDGWGSDIDVGVIW